MNENKEYTSDVPWLFTRKAGTNVLLLSNNSLRVTLSGGGTRKLCKYFNQNLTWRY